jgi:hypothetical protein
MSSFISGVNSLVSSASVLSLDSNVSGSSKPSVSFEPLVRVVLIPCRKEYQEAGLVNVLWTTKADQFRATNLVAREIIMLKEQDSKTPPVSWEKFIYNLLVVEEMKAKEGDLPIKEVSATAIEEIEEYVQNFLRKLAERVN